MPLKGLVIDGEAVDFDRLLTEERWRRRVPAPLVSTLRIVEREHADGSTHITGLLQPNRVLYLKNREDYYDLLDTSMSRIIGQLAHMLIKFKGDFLPLDQLLEERVGSDASDLAVGRLDYYDAEFQVLWDFKVLQGFKMGQVAKGNVPRDFSIQINFYRMHLERQGFPVLEMNLYAVCLERSFMTFRDNTPRELCIPMGRISDAWVDQWVLMRRLEVEKIHNNPLPPRLCSDKETWVKEGESYVTPWDRKRCEKYCSVREACIRAELPFKMCDRCRRPAIGFDLVPVLRFYCDRCH